jgi:hypothetical protein
MLIKKAPIFGAFFLFDLHTIPHCAKSILRIPLVVWYIAYKDASQAVLSISKQNNAPWEGKWPISS